ncbi:MAG: restriction endonuclease subunit S, partial [Porticoccaceae bacterium]
AGEGPGERAGDLLTPDERGRLARNIKGYDISPDMVRLSLVNLYLHGFTDPHIFEYDTLTSQERWNETADVILANPPFMSPKGGIKPHNRFSVQSKRSEVLFVDYMAEHLTPSGRAGIIVPEGIIFQSQGAYTQLRKMLVEDYLIAVVSLPAGVFQPYSGVKTSILILDKSLARTCDRIAFFKVQNDGFGLGAQRRAIASNDLPAAAAALRAFRHSRPRSESRAGSGGNPGDAANQTFRHSRACGNPADFDPSHYPGLLVVEKSRIAANGDYNLSRERYREGVARASFFPTVPLGKVCHLIGGATPSKQDESYWTNGSVKWISSKHIDERGVITAYELISNKAVEETSTRVAPRGSTIIITRVSVGKFAFADDDYAINQDLTALVSKDNEQLDPEFIRVAAHHIADVVERNAVGIGVRGVTRNFLAELEIPLPPLEVQKEIVAEIEGYQKVIDGARAVLDNYRPHIPIHPDWPMVELGEVCEAIVTGPFGSALHQSDYVDNGIPVINPQNIVEGNISTDGVKMVSPATRDRLKEFTVREDDIVIGRRGEMGRCGVVTSGMTGWLCGTGSFVIRLKDVCLARFAFFQIASPKVKQYLEEQAIGVTMKNLNQGILSSIQLPLPPLATQQAIVAEIEAEQALVNANRELIARFEQKIQATLARVWGEDAPDIAHSGAVLDATAPAAPDFDADQELRRVAEPPAPDYSFT